MHASEGRKGLWTKRTGCRSITLSGSIGKLRQEKTAASWSTASPIQQHHGLGEVLLVVRRCNTSLWAAWKCLQEKKGQWGVHCTSDLLSQFHTTSWCGRRKFDFPCVNSKGLGYLQLLLLYAWGGILQGAGAEMGGCGRYSICWHLEAELPIRIPSLPSHSLPA